MPSNRQRASIIAPVNPAAQMVRVIATARHKDPQGNRRRIDDVFHCTVLRARELEALGHARILGPGPTEEKRAPGKARAPIGGAAPSPLSPPVLPSPLPIAPPSAPALSQMDAEALATLQRAAEATARGRHSPSRTHSR